MEVTISWFPLADSSLDYSDSFSISVSFEQDCAAHFNSWFLWSFLSGIINLIKNQWFQVWILLLYGFLFLLYNDTWFYSLLLLGSNSVSIHYYLVLFSSYLVHFTLSTKLWWLCAAIFIKPTIKKTKQNNTEQKNLYDKIWLKHWIKKIKKKKGK